jgi:hypothetical protein
MTVAPTIVLKYNEIAAVRKHQMVWWQGLKGMAGVNMAWHGGNVGCFKAHHQHKSFDLC